MNKIVKLYNQVEIGDLAYENPDAAGNWDNVIGEVIDKGRALQLRRRGYDFSGWKELGLSYKDIDEEYDLVVVQDGKEKIVMNYDNDPSGCVVFLDNSIQHRIANSTISHFLTAKEDFQKFKYKNIKDALISITSPNRIELTKNEAAELLEFKLEVLIIEIAHLQLRTGAAFNVAYLEEAKRNVEKALQEIKLIDY